MRLGNLLSAVPALAMIPRIRQCHSSNLLARLLRVFLSERQFVRPVTWHPYNPTPLSAPHQRGLPDAAPTLDGRVVRKAIRAIHAPHAVTTPGPAWQRAVVSAISDMRNARSLQRGLIVVN